MGVGLAGLERQLRGQRAEALTGAALVAGDIVATEDGNGTLKTILTRSVDRWQIFVAKVLAAFTYAFAALVLYVGVGLVIGGLIWGFDPLISLSGSADLRRAARCR